MERVRPDEIGKREPQSEAHEQRPTYVKVDKNFLNYPLARDRRSAGEWRRHEKSKRWHHERHDEITFSLPSDIDAKHRHDPTPFDVNLLFSLIAQARLGDSNTIDFASLADVLRLLRLGADTNNRRRVGEALEYWSKIAIRFDHWYHPRYREPDGMSGDGKKARRELPPPLRIKRRARGVRVVVDPAWTKGEGRYHAWVPLPLPQDAATQNLVLSLFAFKDTPQRRKLSSLRRKFGLRRRDVLLKAVERAQEWFEKHGGSLDRLRLDAADDNSVFAMKIDVTRWEKANAATYADAREAAPKSKTGQETVTRKPREKARTPSSARIKPSSQPRVRNDRTGRQRPDYELLREEMIREAEDE